MSHPDRPLVTIAIPTYNRADGFLVEALESALAQTYSPLEILVSDNCSTDETPALVRGYDDSRIRYVRHETNLGAQGNFQYCVDEAQGAFFLMLHDDDRIDPEMVATCMEVVETPEGTGYIRTGNRLIDGAGEVIETRPNEAAGTSGVDAVLEWMRCNNFWALSSTLYETAALREAGRLNPPDFPLTCDCYATSYIALHVGGIELRPIRASFRIHDGEIESNTDQRKWINEWKHLYREILSWAPSSKDRARLKREGERFFSRLCYRHADRMNGWTRFREYLSVFTHFWRLPPGVHYRFSRLRSTLSGHLPLASES